MFGESFSYKYTPILSLSPSEMNAIEELPEKDKDLILPLIPLKGWVGSQSLNNSVPRIEKAIGKKRKWIADIDGEFLTDKLDSSGGYPREVFYQIEELMDSKGGYRNWFNFLKEIDNAIPVVQVDDLSNMTAQLENLYSLGRGIVLRFNIIHIQNGTHADVAYSLSCLGYEDVFVIFDYEQIDSRDFRFWPKMAEEISKLNSILPSAKFAISCTSFPMSFAGYDQGENPITERLIFNKIRTNNPGFNLVYSDRGGARAEKLSGGSGAPAPRIDYPLPNDWRFIRLNTDKEDLSTRKDRERAYSELAKRVIASDYWEPELRLWGTQVIELTARGELLGINNPARSTAVRINIHLYKQLHYDTPVSEFDTDEEWFD